MTLLEILAILIIIGILAAIALPNFAPVREKVLDKEASASLKLIQAAQKIYKMETGFYFPYSDTESNQNTINTNLKILLPTDDATRKWTYKCADTASGTTSCSDATRTTSGGGDPNKRWRLQITGSEPDSGACP